MGTPSCTTRDSRQHSRVWRGSGMPVPAIAMQTIDGVYRGVTDHHTPSADTGGSAMGPASATKSARQAR